MLPSFFLFVCVVLLLPCFSLLEVDRVDDLVDGYSQFTALADEASKGLAVDGVKDPLGRTSHVPTAAVAAAAATASAEAPTSQQHTAASSSSRRRRQGPKSPAPLFGDGGGGGAPAAVPAFASAGAASAAAPAEGAPGGAMAVGVDPIQDPVARDALKLLFSKEGNYVQVRLPAFAACRVRRRDWRVESFDRTGSIESRCTLQYAFYARHPHFVVPVRCVNT